MRYNKFINNKLSPNILNKFFFLGSVPNVNKILVHISNFKENEKVNIASLMEEIFCVKPVINSGGFVYDKTGNKVFFDYLLLRLNDKDLIYNFLMYFYIITKNYKHRKLFFRGITNNTFIGIMSTYDIQNYFFREIFSYIPFNFPFIVDFEKTKFNNINIILNYHFFKNLGII